MRIIEEGKGHKNNTIKQEDKNKYNSCSFVYAWPLLKEKEGKRGYIYTNSSHV